AAAKRVVPSAVSGMTESDRYHLLHLPTHLLDLDEDDAALDCLNEPRWVKLLNEQTAVFFRTWKWSGLVEMYECRIDQYQRLVEAAGGEDQAVHAQPGRVNDLAAAHMNRGNALQGQQRFREAVAAYDRAVGLFERLVAAAGGEDQAVREQPGLVNDLASAHMNRGSALAGQQRFGEAVAAYDRAVGLFERLVAAAGGEDQAVR